MTGRFAVVLSVAFVAWPAAGQQAVELERVATLGRSPGDSEPLITVASRVTRDGRGRYYVAPTAEPGLFSVYGSTGSFLAAVGHAGEGPGEYGLVVRVVPGLGDSVYVFDTGNGRLSTLTPDYDFVRSRPAHHSMVDDAVVLPGHGILVAQVAWTRDAAGLPFHLYSKDEIRSFGARPTERRVTVVEGHWEVRRRVAAARTGDQFWAIRYNEYKLERWTVEGEFIEAIDAEAGWFEAWHDQGQGDVLLSKPAIVGLQRVSSGNLWVLARTPDPDAPELTGDEMLGPSLLHERADAVLELRSPAGGLLAHGRFDEMLMPLAEDLFIRPRETHIGLVELEVVRAVATNQSPQERRQRR